MKTAVHKSGYVCTEEGRVYHPVRGNEVGSLRSRDKRYVICVWNKQTKTSDRVMRNVMIWEAFKGDKPYGYDIDHINGDSTDDSLQNLRCITHSQNVQGARKRNHGSSDYRGVSKDREWWKAQVVVDKKQFPLGLYKTELEAAQKRDEAAFQLGYPLEGLNFPEDFEGKERTPFVLGEWRNRKRGRPFLK
jgi:hypothetical protein